MHAGCIGNALNSFGHCKELYKLTRLFARVLKQAACEPTVYCTCRQRPEKERQLKDQLQQSIYKVQSVVRLQYWASLSACSNLELNQRGVKSLWNGSKPLPSSTSNFSESL